jgi:hypothetical protein
MCNDIYKKFLKTPKILIIAAVKFEAFNVEHVSGLGHPGGVEHPVDFVVLEETAMLVRGRQ